MVKDDCKYASDGLSHDGRDADRKPFDKTTLWWDTISTEEGRRHIAIYPAVRALCNAMQLAGYRVEMDDEGDLWFEDDDGDCYYDAKEYQPKGDENSEESCPICRDPDKYGLGYILRRADVGERLFQKWLARRADRKERGKKRFW